MIETVMFDMGGTLEDVYADEATYRRTAKRLHEMLCACGMDPGMDAGALWDIVFPAFMVYKDESVATGMEKKPEEIWTQYCLKDFPFDMDRVAAESESLAHMWEVQFYDRRLRPHVKELLDALKSLGLRLGVISNTPSLFQVYDSLNEYGIRPYLDAVVVSSIVGYRKPGKRIFEIALAEMNVSPGSCAYVGDTIARDIIGAKCAGYAKTFQIHSFLTDSRDTEQIKRMAKPDHLITDLFEVYEILKRERESG